MIEPEALEEAAAEIEAMRAASSAKASSAKASSTQASSSQASSAFVTQRASEQTESSKESNESKSCSTPIHDSPLATTISTPQTPISNSSNAPTSSIALCLECVKPIDELTGPEAIQILKSLSQTVRIGPRNAAAQQPSTSSLTSAAAVAPTAPSPSSTSIFTPAAVSLESAPVETPNIPIASPTSSNPLQNRTTPDEAGASVASSKRKREVKLTAENEDENENENEEASTNTIPPPIRPSQRTLRRSQLASTPPEESRATSSNGNLQPSESEIAPAAPRTRAARTKRRKT